MDGLSVSKASFSQPLISSAFVQRCSLAAFRSFQWQTRGNKAFTSTRVSVQEFNDKKVSGALRLFLKSANAEEWKNWLPTGVFYGVSTNPVLLQEARVACNPKHLALITSQARQLGAQEVQLQAWGKSADDLIAIGSQLAEIDSCVVVRIPATRDGFKAASKLNKLGTRLAMSDIYSVHQVLLAIGMGVEYASPNLGGMKAAGKPGEQDVNQMQGIIKGVGSQCRLLVEGIENIDQISLLACQGVKSFAVPTLITEQLLADPDTIESATKSQLAASRNTFSLFL